MKAQILKENAVSIILSGGLSARMKKHKALLRFSAQQNFMQHIIEEYHNAGITNIVVVKNIDINSDELQIELPEVSIVDNPSPEKGRLYSIQLGLKKSTGAEHYFIQNIDNPFVTSDLINNLFAVKASADYVAPQFQNMGGHPILISSVIAKEILSLKEYNKTLRDVLKGFTCRKLHADNEHCILNINLPSDYEKLFLSNNLTRPFV
jgi:CTP:molybdopterin cytidylyltransferase MocA